jgi:hypothetical protein
LVAVAGLVVAGSRLRERLEKSRKALDDQIYVAQTLRGLIGP